MKLLNTVQLAGLLSALACSASETGGVNYSPVSLQGIVQDSVSGKAVTSVSILLDNQPTTIDATGLYRFDGVTPGEHTLDINAPGFEVFTKRLTIATDTRLDVGLRKVTPYLTSFSSSGLLVEATYTDLQGAGSINLAGSFMTVSGSNSNMPSYTLDQSLAKAVVTPIDSRSIHLSISSEPGIQKVVWTVRDAQGNFHATVCFVGGSCAE